MHAFCWRKIFSFFACRSYVNKLLERFSLECRKVIGFAFATLHGLKISRQFFIQSEVKPIVTHSHVFSRSLRQLNVITSSFDWFNVLCVFFVIG